MNQKGGLFTCITQADHARFAAELLSLWRTDGLPEHPRRKALLFATREHDNGWLEADAAPRIDRETGAPLSFRDLPSADRVDVWERGTGRHLESNTPAAILIVHHAIELHRERRDDPVWEALLQQMETLRDDLLESVGMTAEALEADYAWLALCDRISLALCEGRLPVSIDRWGKKIHACTEGAGLILRPFPLAGTTTFRIPCRRIPAAKYSSDAELGGRLAEAKWERWEISVAASSSPL